MITFKLKLFIGVFAFTLLLPSTSKAYFTTDQTATRINSETILYTVTYEFGLSGRELYMPIGALRDDNSTTSSPYLKYTLLDKEDRTDIGKSAGLVFSTDEDVEIRDNQYYLAPDKTAKFTLVTLVNLPADQLESNLDLSLLVTSLPFTMVKGGTPIPAHLNPSELQYYRTPTISLKRDKIKIYGSTHTLIKN